MHCRRLSIAIGVGTLALGTSARAENEPNQFSYAWSEPGLQTGVGVGVSLGAGVAGFTDATMRDAISTDIAGLWNARASFGTHIPLGVEVSYLGDAAPLRTLGGFADGTLVGTTVEGTIRYNVLPHFAWNPYVFAGVGWQRYDVASPNFAQSDTGIQSSDNLAEFPMGTGIVYRDPHGLVVDMRATFRAATQSNLLLEQNGQYAQLHMWETSAALGYEF